MIIAKLAGLLSIGLSATIIYVLLGMYGICKLPDEVWPNDVEYPLKLNSFKRVRGAILTTLIAVIIFAIGCLPFLPIN